MTVGGMSLTSLAALNRALPASKRSSLLMYGWLMDVDLACERIGINHQHPQASKRVSRFNLPIVGCSLTGLALSPWFALGAVLEGEPGRC